MCAKKSAAVDNVERAEGDSKPQLQIGMFLSNSQLKLLANFADDPKFKGNKPDGLMIRVGMFPPKVIGGERKGKHTIEIIPYKNNFDDDTKFENLSDDDFNKLIKYFEFEEADKGIGYLDIELGYPEPSRPQFPLGVLDGKTDHNIYKINNEENYGGGGGGPSQIYPRPGSNGNT